MKNIYLKSIRVAAGKTQSQCAKAAKVSLAGYNRVENGKSTLTAECWQRLADFLNVPVAKLTDKAAAANHAKIVNAILSCSKIK